MAVRDYFPLSRLPGITVERRMFKGEVSITGCREVKAEILVEAFY
jgi:hypothetical protein